MLTQETIEKMNAMKLFGLVAAFGTQLSSSEYDELSFEERVGLLVDAEWTDRERRKLSRRLKAREVKILIRLPNGRNVATRQAVYESAPCARTEVVLRKKSIQRYAIFLFADHRPTGAGGSWLETNGKQGKPGNSGPFWV